LAREVTLKNLVEREFGRAARGIFEKGDLNRGELARFRELGTPLVLERMRAEVAPSDLVPLDKRSPHLAFSRTPTRKERRIAAEFARNYSQHVLAAVNFFPRERRLSVLAILNAHPPWYGQNAILLWDCVRASRGKATLVSAKVARLMAASIPP
jgi:hypothetical protein